MAKLLLVAVIGIVVCAQCAFGEGPNPKSFVVEFNRHLSQQLGATVIDPTERRRRFALLVDEGLDFDVLGERLLGWRWQRSGTPDKQAFIREFKSYLIANFGDRIRGVTEGRMRILGARQEGNATLVLADIATQDGLHVPFEWRVVVNDFGMHLSDIVVNDISMTSLMKSQFDAVLPSSSADFSPLIELLRAKSKIE